MIYVKFGALSAQSAIRGQFRKIATSCSFDLNKVRALNSQTWSSEDATRGSQGHGPSLHYHHSMKTKIPENYFTSGINVEYYPFEIFRTSPVILLKLTLSILLI